MVWVSTVSAFASNSALLRVAPRSPDVPKALSAPEIYTVLPSTTSIPSPTRLLLSGHKVPGTVHKSWAKSSIYRWIFHEINRPAIGVPPLMEISVLLLDPFLPINFGFGVIQSYVKAAIGPNGRFHMVACDARQAVRVQGKPRKTIKKWWIFDG
jgi:hypothetical protein